MSRRTWKQVERAAYLAAWAKLHGIDLAGRPILHVWRLDHPPIYQRPHCRHPSHWTTRRPE